MKHEKADIKLYKSKEALKNFKHNRDIKSKVMSPLIESMRREGYRETEPIIVGRYNGDLIIIDGQHRYATHQQLLKSGKDIYYTYLIEDLEGKTDSEVGQRIISYNTQKKTWEMLDYLKLYCGLGYSDYIELNKLIGKDANLGLVLKLFKFAHSSNTTDYFKQGFFKYVKEKENIIMHLLALLKEIKESKKVFLSHFVLPGLYKYLDKDSTKYDKDTFLENIHKLNNTESEKELESVLNRIFK